MKTTNRQVIDEVSYGIYVWQCADGSIAGDGEGNIMNIRSTRGDRDKIEKLRQAARYYGFEEGGKAVFWSGKRPISDEELEMQMERGRQGLVPDPLDIGAIRDEARYLKEHGN